MLRVWLCACLLLSSLALAEDQPAKIDATATMNAARDQLGGLKSYQGALPLTVELPPSAEMPGGQKLISTLAIAYLAPNQLRVEMTHEDQDGKESALFVFGAETIWAQGRIEPRGAAPQVQVRKVIVDKIDSITLGVLRRLKGAEGIPYLLLGRPGLLLEFTAQCFFLNATLSADGKEIVLEGLRIKDPEGLDEAADVLAGIQKVRVTVASADKRLLEVSIEGATGGKLGVSYRDLALDKAPEAATFDYKPPEGAKVEEDDQRVVKPGPPGSEPPPPDGGMGMPPK